MVATEQDQFFDTLIRSAQRLSFDPRCPGLYEPGPDADQRYGMTAQWSPLFDTPIWASMSEQQRILLTRCEVAQFLGIAIWLEVGLQVALLRANHGADPARPDIAFLLNECADENLHSLMFIKGVDSIGAHFYPHDRLQKLLGRLFAMFAWHEVAYGIVLAGEEIFDAMQRDWMTDTTVADAIRRTSYVHVVEESRHMAFARRRIRDQLTTISRPRRFLSTIAIAVGTHIVAKSLINRRVYEELGLRWPEVKSAIDANEHHRMMFRSATASFIEFLHREGLLNRVARRIYRASNLL
ncbi:AurF N-oxygenase family protein [Nocardia sp. CA-151230]|uniref:AurF N-oxygenase family protein n=1 Tax=Nocardia sp. CA-151230 TaxID=3239982 RepID=UPI003D8CAC5C